MYYLEKEQELDKFLGGLGKTSETTADIIDSLFSVGVENDLTLDETGVLYEEARNILSNQTRTNDLAQKIMSKLTYPNPQVASKVADSALDIIEQIRNPSHVPTHKKSSPQTKSSIVSTETIDKVVSNVAQRQRLSDDQKMKLTGQIKNVLAGHAAVTNFRANIVDALDITYDQALKIAFDINTQIFGPVMSTLKKMESTASEDRVEERYEAPEKSTVFRAEVQKKPEIKSGPETHSDRILPDHEYLERTEGSHLHSQTVMPTASTKSYTQPPRQQPASKPTSFGSIVDQKLKNIVSSNTGAVTKPGSIPPTNLPTGDDAFGKKAAPYKNNDPYREPLV